MFADPCSRSVGQRIRLAASYSYVPTTGVPQDNGRRARLRYVSACTITCGQCSLAAALVASPSRVFGSLDGVVVDPATRTLKFLVVSTNGRRTVGQQLLVPFADGAIRFHQVTRTMRVDVEEKAIDACDTFHASSFPKFDDSDLIVALFGRRPECEPAE
jgi:hypothetical protein